MTRYDRLKAILTYLHRERRFVSANEVAHALDLSWKTAKDDLELLTQHHFIIRAYSGIAVQKGPRQKYRFNYERSTLRAAHERLS
jgi:DeoR/GlpR family transcriptional regulator of sugar metabolism